MKTTEYDDFKVSVLKLPGDAGAWNLVYNFLRLRRDVFIGRKKWNLYDADGFEFEQYDVATYATYVIAYGEKEKVLAGARLIRCNQTSGIYSYMIRDAFQGRIDLPSEICLEEPPNDGKSWELTRLLSNSRDPIVAKALLDVTNDFIFEEHGEKCLFLGPPGFIRMAKSTGYDPEKLGPICGDESGRFLAFQCAVRDRMERNFIVE